MFFLRSPFLWKCIDVSALTELKTGFVAKSGVLVQHVQSLRCAVNGKTVFIFDVPFSNKL